jgi:hypothetical protein
VGQLTPKLAVLPKGQQQIWPLLSSTPKDFVLYGGTALALRLGHRDSVDFDFFSNRAFQPMQLLRAVPYLEDSVVRQESENTLSCDVSTEHGIVKISFFGALTLGQLSAPDIADGNAIRVASLIDIFGMKCATIPQRSETKDYRDIHALTTTGKIALTQGIAAAKAIYGNQYNPLLTLQALTYFDDLGEPLPDGIKIDLLAAVKSVSLDKIPTLVASHKIGEGSQHP